MIREIKIRATSPNCVRSDSLLKRIKNLFYIRSRVEFLHNLELINNEYRNIQEILFGPRMVGVVGSNCFKNCI